MDEVPLYHSRRKKIKGMAVSVGRKGGDDVKTS